MLSPRYLRRAAFMAGALSAMLMLGAQTQAAGRVFFEDFEAGSVSQFQQDNSRKMCTAVTQSVDSVAPQGGTHMMECNWNGVVTWDDPAAQSTVVINSFSYTTEFMIRYWVRYATDVDKVGGNKLFKFSNNGGTDFILNGSPDALPGQMVSYFPLLAGQQGPTFWGDGQAFADYKWHRVEIYVKHNSSGASDGIFKVWEDGKPKQQMSNVKTVLPGEKWYPVYFMSNWSNNPGWEHDANNHTYWDNIEVFSDTGTGGSGSMADGSMTATGSSTTPPPAAKTPSSPTAVSSQ